jgi:hypothetical protein
MLKEKLLAALATMVCFMFLEAQSSFAGELQKHIFEVGPEMSYITYKEPSVMKEQGIMYGIAGSYTYHNKLMLKVEGRGSWGHEKISE